MQGDASTRSYERLTLGDKHAIPDEFAAPARWSAGATASPTSAIAHLADNVVPFVAMADGLRRYGFSAPAILHANLDQGLLIIEDLGDERVVADPRTDPGRYEPRSTRCSPARAATARHALSVAPHVEPASPVTT